MFRRILIIPIILLCLSGCKSKNAPEDYEVWGLDVSKHQRNINWEKVVEHECPNFVFIKATEGLIISDPTYDKHAKELDDANVLWGAYHFFGHRTSGKAQARNFIRTAKLKKGNLIPVLDIEKHRFMKDPKKSVREAKNFCREIKRYYGVNPIIYCSTHFYNDYLSEDFSPEEYILWIADYRGNPELDWHFWQHTESYKIEGIKGYVDRNVFYGNVEELKKLVL